MKSISHPKQLAREARSETARGLSSVRDRCPCGSVAYEYPAVGPRWERCVRCLDYRSLGQSNDTPDSVRVEILLAAFLSENAQMYEPGAAHDAADEGAINDAWIVRSVRECPHRHGPPPMITDAEIDRVFAEAPATIREVNEQMRGAVTPWP